MSWSIDSVPSAQAGFVQHFILEYSEDIPIYDINRYVV